MLLNLDKHPFGYSGNLEFRYFLFTYEPDMNLCVGKMCRYPPRYDYINKRENMYHNDTSVTPNTSTTKTNT